MKEEEFEKMFLLEDFYWWFKGRRAIISSVLGDLKPERILDVGCGTGANLSLFNANVIGLDASLEALKLAKRRKSDAQLIQAKAENLPFKDDVFDLVLALDLLEHLPDDVKGLKEMYRVLKKGGTLLVTVPAYKFLWSEHDEALCHFRRYSKGEIAGKMEGVGFSIKFISYAIVFSFFPIVLFRLLQKVLKRANRTPKSSLIILPAFLNDFLYYLLLQEAKMIKNGFSFPFGVSIICRGEK
ncbi:class I SAM-dependent methyltransferase [bacterium]|nr:class I SAM-dependent methyltransferase [bacterium]